MFKPNISREVAMEIMVLYPKGERVQVNFGDPVLGDEEGTIKVSFTLSRTDIPLSEEDYRELYSKSYILITESRLGFVDGRSGVRKDNTYTFKKKK